MHFTFLNWPRLPSIIPKDPTTIGFCEFLKIVGNNCCTLIGNKYQSNRSNRSVISSNALVILWQTSHEKNTIPNTETPKKINFHSRTGSTVSADCKAREICRIYFTHYPFYMILIGVRHKFGRLSQVVVCIFALRAEH